MVGIDPSKDYAGNGIMIKYIVFKGGCIVCQVLKPEATTET
jgi:hypothetical protein